MANPGLVDRLAVDEDPPLLVAALDGLPGQTDDPLDGVGVVARPGAEQVTDVSGGVEQATQAVADAFATNIAAHPADWHMLQPLWPKDAPKPSRRREMERRLRQQREQGR